MLRQLAVVISALTLSVCLASCGSDNSDDPVLPAPDAGNPDPGDKPDAGGTPDSGNIDPGPSCSAMTQKVERALTVTCDGKTIDFSGDFFYVRTDEYDADSFNVLSADDKYLLAVDIYGAGWLPASTCHHDYALPLKSDQLDFYILDVTNNFATLGWAGTPTSQGSFIFDGFALKNGAWEVSFGCSDCTLVSDETVGGKTPRCTMNGTFREVTTESL